MVELVKDNLHFALAMSPVGDKFRVRTRQYPSLVNCCQIICMEQWGDEAM